MIHMRVKTELKTVTLVSSNMDKDPPIVIEGAGWRVISHSRYDGQGTYTTGKTWHTLVLAREIPE